MQYLPTFSNKIQANVGRYASPMDPMGTNDTRSPPKAAVFPAADEVQAGIWAMRFLPNVLHVVSTTIIYNYIIM